MHGTLINRHGAVLSGSEQRWDGRVLGNATHGKLHPSMSERRRVPWRPMASTYGVRGDAPLRRLWWRQEKMNTHCRR